MTSWHALTAADAMARLDSGPDGLTDPERAARLARTGPNAVDQRRPEPWWAELLESFAEPLQLLLIAVAVLSAVFGELSDAIAIAAVIAVVAVLETTTELRAKRAIAALRAMTAATARLHRPGGPVVVPAADLVPGDVLLVEAGDVVPADARVLTAAGLRVDEATLTGESAPVGKGPQPVPDNADLADRSSLLHAGTAVLAGEGRAVVVATGPASELGRIGGLVATTREPPTPLQTALRQLAGAVLVLAIGASVLVPVVGLLAGQPWRDMLLSGLTVAFATVPEELPILVTVLLAVGGRRLARHGALLRRLRAGETLGAVTTVVTDKTGTLTENRLELVDLVGDPDQVLRAAVAAQPDDASSREPLEVALAEAAAARGVRPPGPVLAAIPFDPATRTVTRLRALPEGALPGGGVPGRAVPEAALPEGALPGGGVPGRAVPEGALPGGAVPSAAPPGGVVPGGAVLAVAGAPEAVLARCALPPDARGAAERRVSELSAAGRRVIAFATRTVPAAPPPSAPHPVAELGGLEFAGLAAFADPLRAGVPAAVAALRTAGVATVVVTGDHPDTAAAVAGQAGLPADGARFTGSEVDGMTDDELSGVLRHGTVIARATPDTKHRVVRALHRRREVVAVTGDGANDAPALAAADVGIALGRRAADLARAAADLVLTDDSYPTVVTAVATGRNLGAQLRRAVAFYLGAKLALVVVLVAALAAGLPSPFQPVHIVLLEVFLDLGASVAFVAEPGAPAAMRRPPRPPGARFLDGAVVTAIGATAGTLVLAVLPAYLVGGALGGGVGPARSAAVLAWLAGHGLVAWALRTRPGLSWAANPAFPAWVGTAVVTGLVVTSTPLAGPLHLTALSGPLLAAVAGLVLLAATQAAGLARVADHVRGGQEVARPAGPVTR